MNHVHARSNFWSLSDIELAKECRVIAESPSASVSATVKAEAVRQKEVDEHKGMIGGSFYLAKPVSADGLISAIEGHIRH